MLRGGDQVTDDIVARLRKQEVGKYNALLWDEAADEIERLRAALLELREAADAVSWTETLTVSAFERVRIAETVADEILGRKAGRVPMEDECGG